MGNFRKVLEIKIFANPSVIMGYLSERYQFQQWKRNHIPAYTEYGGTVFVNDFRRIFIDGSRTFDSGITSQRQDVNFAGLPQARAVVGDRFMNFDEDINPWAMKDYDIDNRSNRNSNWAAGHRDDPAENIQQRASVFSRLWSQPATTIPFGHGQPLVSNNSQRRSIKDRLGPMPYRRDRYWDQSYDALIEEEEARIVRMQNPKIKQYSETELKAEWVFNGRNESRQSESEINKIKAQLKSINYDDRDGENPRDMVICDMDKEKQRDRYEREKRKKRDSSTEVSVDSLENWRYYCRRRRDLSSDRHGRDRYSSEKKYKRKSSSKRSSDRKRSSSHKRKHHHRY